MSDSWFTEKGATMSDEIEDGSEIGQDLDDPTTPDNSSEEIAARTTDTDEDETRLYRKEFLVGAPWDPDYDYADDDHEANAAAVAQDAINAGLRVVGDIVFVGAEDSGTPYGRRGQTCVTLVYEAEAVPAHLVGAGPTPETSDVEGTLADVVSPRDVIKDDNPQPEGAKHSASEEDGEV